MTDHERNGVEEPRQTEPEGYVERFRSEIEKKEARRERARAERRRGLWYGLGMFGLVGWSVAIPTVLGVALGLFLDRTRSDPISWTLTGLVVGVAAGCLNAWFWIQREGRLR